MAMHYYVMRDGVQVSAEYDDLEAALAALAALRQEGHRYELGEIIVDEAMGREDDPC